MRCALLITDRPPLPADGRRDLIAASALLACLAVLTGLIAAIHLMTVRQDRAWVLHSHKVIEATQDLFTLVLNVESGQRGYLLSKANPVYLDEYADSRDKIPAAEAALSGLVEDNPAQVADVARMSDAINQRLAISAQRVALAKAGHLDQAIAIRFSAGQKAMNLARQARADVMRRENQLLGEREARARRADLISLGGAMTLSLLAMAGLFSVMRSLAGANRRLAREMREREAAQAALSRREARYRAIFDNTADLLYVLDVTSEGDVIMTEVNPAYEAAVGASGEALRGQSLRSVAHPSQIDTILTHMNTVAAGTQPVFSRHMVTLPAGDRIWESMLTPVRDGEGGAISLIGASRDVTERERAREQLRKAQRMEAVGQLTGGVAHDFNNLLQVIRGNLELIASQVSESAAGRVKNALHAAERAAQLTRQLLAFSRRQPLEPKPINLGRLVTDMAEMLRRSLGEAVEVETVIAGGLWNTLADPAQVESAVLNLALNARDAMPGGGRLTIEITNAVLDETYASSAEDLTPGQYVLLAVSDTGHGMDRETLARVFEPFFTTKGEDRGTGLGLSMVYGFVKQSNGHVQIYSEIGQGTTVKIYLPRSRQAEQAREIPPLGSLRGRSEVILVVEDDDLVRASAVSMLRDLGYDCRAVHDGVSALAVLQGDAKIDLLFTDVVMPGPLKSRDLAREAESLRPGLPVLYTSGYTENAIVHQGRLDEGVQLLSKPYSRDGLARKLRAMLKSVRPVVLVVEDDPLVRLSAVDMIDALGFTTCQAADAAAALQILQRGERVDVLFTDVGLPGMRGGELAKLALKARGGLRVIFASGYGETEETAGVAGAVHLAKPYEQDQLAEVLSRMDGRGN